MAIPGLTGPPGSWDRPEVTARVAARSSRLSVENASVEKASTEDSPTEDSPT
ncbi:MAG: hypothetical protein NVSMB16_10780 [Acidimicrobiales bacterium]